MPDTIDVSEGFKITVLSEIDLMAQYREQLVKGLSEPSEPVPTVYYYDDAGSVIFEKMCEEPSYYPPKVEMRLLRRHAGDIARAIGPADVVELGCGNSTKTKVLLSAFAEAFGRTIYRPIDVNKLMIEKGGAEIAEALPRIAIDGLVGSYEEAVARLRGDGRRKTFLFLGSTMAQFTDEAVREFVEMLRGAAGPEDTFLVGFDLYKDPEMLAAPYNTPIADEHQWNGLRVINRVFDGNFDPNTIESSGRWNEAEKRIQMTLRFTEEQDVSLKDLNFRKVYPRGYETITHIMRKMPVEDVLALMEGNGLRLVDSWRDPEIDYGLFLFRF